MHRRPFRLPRSLRAPALWSSTDRDDGGRALAYAEAGARLQQVLADRAGTDPVSWPVPELGLVRGRRALVLVHTTEGQLGAEVQGRPVRLGAYEVRYVPLQSGRPADLAVPVASIPSPDVPAADRCLSLTSPSAQPPVAEATR